MPKPRKAARSDVAAAADTSCMIVVRAVPRSSRVLIQAEGEAAYKIKLTAPPADGRANAQLIEILSKALKLPGSSFQIVSGSQGRVKRIRILGRTADAVSRMLLEPE